MGQLTYVPGHSIEEAQQASGRTKIVKAGSNENALGPSPKAQAAMQCALAEVHLYPDQHESALRRKLAYQLGGGFTEDNFVSGNGSCDVLRMITQTFIRPGDKALITAPTFPMFQLLTRLFGG
ncbi:MAG: aminotransferase class I/II-fold pyridoxal phosphate-dependent enzyme, partial [Chloroflexi bacterium]|nr:aminotransferase class I/II-fold pyridoxal phosphate-dependent enzyme [Chloroflexota bacterium]